MSLFYRSKSNTISLKDFQTSRHISIWMSYYLEKSRLFEIIISISEAILVIWGHDIVYNLIDWLKYTLNQFGGFLVKL